MSKIESESTSLSGLEPDLWLERHGDFLFRFALARVRRKEAAEELVQETLLAAWRGRGEFQRLSSERTWLTAILKRKVVDWLRLSIRERLHSYADESEPFGVDLFTRRGLWKSPPGRWSKPEPTCGLEREEFWLVLNNCLNKLPARLREPLS